MKNLSCLFVFWARQNCFVFRLIARQFGVSLRLVCMNAPQMQWFKRIRDIEEKNSFVPLIPENQGFDHISGNMDLYSKPAVPWVYHRSILASIVWLNRRFASVLGSVIVIFSVLCRFFVHSVHYIITTDATMSPNPAKNYLFLQRL